MSTQQRNALRRMKNLNLVTLWIDELSAYVTTDQIAVSERLAAAVNRQLDKNYGKDGGF